MEPIGTQLNSSSRGLVRFVPNSEIIKTEQQIAEAHENQNQPVITALSGHIQRRWEAARESRVTIEDKMLRSLRQRTGIYDPIKLSQIRQQGGSEIYMMLTSIKCRAAESWINEILFPPGEKPWEVKPTTIPELNPDLMLELAEFVKQEASQAFGMGLDVTIEKMQGRFQQIKKDLEQRVKEKAEERAAAMGRKIDDQFQDGDWRAALKEVIKDTCTYQAGILKGPVFRRRKSMKWVEGERGWSPEVRRILRPEWYRVAPYDFYPSPNCRKMGDGYCFERHRLRREDLVAMLGVPGYDAGAITLALQSYGIGGLRQWLWRDQQRADLENRPNEWLSHDDTIDALEYYGNASGQMLMDWGMDKSKIDDPNAEYAVNVWKIGSYIIRAVLNDSPLGEWPYDRACFEEIPGAFWGISLPELMRDVQDVCNAAARSLVNNMAIASGPMVEVNYDRVPEGQDITQLHPWIIFQTKSDPNGRNNPAVRFHNPNPIANVLMEVYKHFAALADEYTGIPPYTYGQSNIGGAGKTASGLSMLMGTAARGMKLVVSHIDVPIEGSVRRMYEYNMMYDEDDSIKGDLRAIARGSASLLAKEQQQIRRGEFLDKTNNPVDMSIIGLEGRAALLRESVKSLDIRVDDVVPDKEAMMERVRADAMAAIPGQPGEQGRNLDAAGNPAGGQDAALFGGG